MFIAENQGIPSSLMSFPNRGPWGNRNYRGNGSGFVQKGLIEHFRPDYFVDPAEGSGTSRDVARDLGVRYTGLDLHSGFNLLRDNLRKRIERPADLIFFHPPYGEMIKYSGNMWGEAHPDDLSRVGNGDEFCAKMEIALKNIHDALEKGGYYAVLIGDMRKDGEYISWQSDIIGLKIGKLKGICIKSQHNCVSDKRNYSGNFIPINHEYLMIFARENVLVSMGEFLLEKGARIAKRHAGTWKEIIARVFHESSGELTIDQTVKAVLERIDSTENKHVEAKVRQILQSPAFQKLAPGRYALAA